MTHTTDGLGAKPEHSKESRGHKKGLHRRKFLGGMAGAAGLAAVGAAGATFSLLTGGNSNMASAADATGTLTIPDLLEATTSDDATTYTLTPQPP